MSSPARTAVSERSTLLRLYLGRGILAVVWAVAFAGVHEDLGAAAITLLVVHPAIDSVSSLLDHRATPDGFERRVIALNGILSALAAAALRAAGTHGVAPVLHVFGAWALVSGLAQVLVGLRRRGPEFGRQCPTLVSGALSFLVGITYNIQAAGDSPSLGVLSVYATGGGVWFILQALLLGRRTRLLEAAGTAG
ncbi:DUF308 domain-containing protein [Streptomyces longispororuber]|uniref:DUF308 domain-containing protein n=1 Tax=Streptomyces longispororuber TaxID=68230 RepID=UPI002108A97E|nr:DUF308 domain-containing protein [Streptomyces longispororuber]MCQ4212940.1 DUF308 domain-containing protein [Streptomyces longispororuber]